LGRDRLDDAAEAFRAALRLDPKALDAHRWLGEIAARRGDLASAAAGHDSWFRRWVEEPAASPLRERQERAIGRGVPPILIAAMLKSASEYIREVLMNLLDVPELHVSVGAVPIDAVIPSAATWLARGGALCRTHMDGSPANLEALLRAGLRRGVVHLRDPRQATLSWIHMIGRSDDADFTYSAQMYRPSIPIEFRAWTRAEQLDWAVDHYLPGQVGWVESWIGRIDNSDELSLLVTSYELFRRDPVRFFAEVLAHFGVDVDEARVLAAMPVRESTRNFRAGDPDEWRRVFTPAQIERALRMIPVALRHRFGWDRASG